MTRSYFLITVNTNKTPGAYGADAARIGGELQRIGRLLTQRANVQAISIRPFRSGGGPAPVVTGVGARGRIEVGGTVGRLHQHILLRVDHGATKLHLDIPAIKQFYLDNDRTGLIDFVYVNVHGFSDAAVVARYIEKDADAERTRARRIAEEVHATVPEFAP